MADLDALDRLMVKPKRAKKHILDLDLACDAFSNSSPYTVNVDIDPRTQEHTYRIATIQRVPFEIAAIAGDALQNLRSALDHLAYHLVEVANNKPTTQTGFPIFESAVKFGSREKTAKVQGMTKEAIQAIEELKPYGGANDTLWYLHKLNNTDKHRLVIAVATKKYWLQYDSFSERRCL